MNNDTNEKQNRVVQVAYLPVALSILTSVSQQRGHHLILTLWCHDNSFIAERASLVSHPG